VVIDTGLGDWSTGWGFVQQEVAKTTRVCTYDRAGWGWSDTGHLPRNAAQFAEELHTLLQNANSCTIAGGCPSAVISIPAVLARFGVVRLLALLLGLIPYVPPDEKAYYSRFVRTQNAQALTDESPGMPAAGAEAAAVKTFGDLPLIVLTAGLNNIPGWQEWQTELLQLSSNSLQVQIEEPDAAVAAIIQMVEQVRQTVKK
jgi:hypothetical protein